MGTETFPNPLELTLGDGKTLIHDFRDADGTCGILLRRVDKDYAVGELVPEAKVPEQHDPQSGELYLRFTKPQSAMVLMEALMHVILNLMGLPRIDASRASGEHGWLIERADSEPSNPVYFTGHAYTETPWSLPGDVNAAIRFARHVDAAAVAELLAHGQEGVTHRVTEHEWSPVV